MIGKRICQTGTMYTIFAVLTLVLLHLTAYIVEEYVYLLVWMKGQHQFNCEST